MEYKPTDRFIHPITKDIIVPTIDDLDTIYHYTSLEGFEGILNNKTLRFTNIGCLNDSAEVVDGVNDLIEKLSNETTLDEDGNIIEVSNESSKERLREHLEQTKQNTFVFCSSLDYDSLAMWRYYLKSKKMNGYNIAFSYSKLLRTLYHLNTDTLKDTKIGFGIVKYEKEQKSKLIELLINHTVQDVSFALQKMPSLNIKDANKRNEFLKDIDRREKDYKTKNSLLEYNLFYMNKEKDDTISFKPIKNLYGINFCKNRTFSYEKEFRIAITFTDEQLATLKSNRTIKSTEDQGHEKQYLDLTFDINSIVGLNSAPLMSNRSINKGNKIKNNIPKLKNININPSASSVRF